MTLEQQKRFELLKQLSEAHQQVLPRETGVISEDGTTYNRNAGLPGFPQMIYKEFNKTYPDDQEMLESAKKNMLDRMLMEKAKEEMIQEGYDPQPDMAMQLQKKKMLESLT
jgi:hypothetical protein